ncbi:MAG: hypothetical protein ABIQ95_13770 [Bdellovibrionia bacterium]
MSIKKRFLINYLILSLCTVSAFGNGGYANQDSVDEIQPAAQFEMIDLGNESPDLYSQLEAGRAKEAKQVRKDKRSQACCRNVKKVVAVAVSVALLGGLAVAVAAPYIWPVSECKFIYDPLTKICSIDNGDAIPYFPPGDPKRGMYVSLWTDEFTMPTEHKEYEFILGNDEKERRLLDFIVRHRIDALTLYNLGVIFDTQGLSEKLNTFIVKAKSLGVKEMVAVGSNKFAFETIDLFQKKYPARFDILLTEFEFWNLPMGQRDQGYKEFVELLKYMKSLGIKNVVTKRDLKVAAYFGFLNRLVNTTATDIAKTVIENTDRIYQHCYGTGEANSKHDPAEAYFDCSGKMAFWLPMKQQMGRGVQNPQIVPLFSAEGKAFHSINALPTEYYVGDWMRDHTNLDVFENTTREVIKGYNDPNLLTGFHYYEYMYLDYFLSRAGNVTQPK